MNHPLLLAALLAALSLSACDRPTVVTVPVPVAVPGPAGPAGPTGATGYQGNPGDPGATGNQGNQGNDGNTGATGQTGKPGDSTTVIVMPPASAPAN